MHSSDDEYERRRKSDRYDEDDDRKRKSKRSSRSSDDDDDEKGDTIRLRPFNFEDMPPFTGKANEMGKGVKIVVIGKAGSGKSSVLRDIIASKSHLIPVAQVFSGTEDSNSAYSQMMPDVTVFNKLDFKALENFKLRQKLAGKWLKYPYAFNIIDDCTDDPKLLKKPIIQDIYKNGRHWHMVHILTLQYCLDIPPAIRNNYDYAFIFKENILSTREKLWKYFGACVHKFSDFNNLLDEITGDYTALVIKNSASATTPEECLFWYKADPENFPKNWKLGSSTAWEFHNDRRDPHAVESL
jgi:hypothetical protein